MYKKIFSKANNKKNVQNQSSNQTNSAPISSTSTELAVTIIPRSQHSISRQQISENALKVLYRLKKHHYEAYLVGGCVRDLLLGKTPKDFDITTNATPEQIQRIFRNCRLVGRRFRLAHILFGREIIEVATFRGEHSDENHADISCAKRSQAGMLLRDNVYGKTIQEDAIRRDFTVNALYYDIRDFSIRDYCNGIEDLQKRTLRLIGDPQTRYREDPVRMLRAVRFAAKLNMTIEENTAEPIRRLAPLLKNIPNARLFDESIKLLQSGYGFQVYQLLREFHLLAPLFPILDRAFIAQKTHRNNISNAEKIVEQVLKNTDYRINHQQRVNPAFLFSAFLWYPLCERAQELILESGLTYHDAFSLAISDILTEQCSTIAIPKRFTSVMSEIWRLQLRMSKLTSKRVFAIFEHPKFRAAYDLLELRSSVEQGELLTIAKWWDEFQHANSEQQKVMLNQCAHNNHANRPKKYRHKKHHFSKSSA